MVTTNARQITSLLGTSLKMYQGSPVAVVEINGCLARVKLVEEPARKPFLVGLDDLVDLSVYKARVEAGESEAPADLMEMVEAALVAGNAR